MSGTNPLLPGKIVILFVIQVTKMKCILRGLMAITILIYFINSKNIYIDPEPQKLVGPLLTLSNLSTWCQVHSKIYTKKTKVG